MCRVIDGISVFSKKTIVNTLLMNVQKGFLNTIKKNNAYFTLIPHGTDSDTPAIFVLVKQAPQRCFYYIFRVSDTITDTTAGRKEVQMASLCVPITFYPLTTPSRFLPSVTNRQLGVQITANFPPPTRELQETWRLCITVTRKEWRLVNLR